VTDLFRRQAIDHQRQRFHGAIVLTRDPWRTAWAALALILVGSLAVFAATQGFSRKDVVTGVLQPAGGLLRLVAPQAGVVNMVAVAGEAPLHAGDLLVRISTEQVSSTGPTREAVARSLDQRQAGLQDDMLQQDAQRRQRAAALDTRMAGLRASMDQHAHEIELQRERLHLAQDVAARYPGLVLSGAVSSVEAAEKAAEVVDQQARLAALQRDALSLKRELDAVEAERAALPLQAHREQTQLQRDVLTLAQQQAENEALRNIEIRSPVAGHLTVLRAGLGQAVAAGQTLATVWPQGNPLEAELDVPSRAAGFVQAGTPVWIRVDAFPYARHGQLAGTVREVTRGVMPSSIQADMGSDPTVRESDAKSVFRVRVTLSSAEATDPTQDWRARLKPGMHVQASLVAERRTLLEWVLEPLAELRAAANLTHSGTARP